MIKCNRHNFLICASMIVLAMALISGISCSGNRLEEYKAEGLVAFEQKNYKLARSFFAKALHEKPSDRDAAYYMGVSFKNDFHYDSAMFYLKRVDILNVNDREVALEMYQVALAMMDWEIATTAMNVLINTGDPEEKYYAKRAELWTQRDHPYNAYFYTKLAIEYDPSDEQLYLNAARLAEFVDSLPVSLAYVDTAIARFGVKPQFLSSKGLYLNKMGEHKEASKIYRALMQIDSTRADLKYNLAKSLERQDSRIAKSEALELYREILPQLGYQLPIDSLIKDLETILQ